jgi:hypothetical protein
MRSFIFLTALVLVGCSSGPKYTVDEKLLASATTDEKKGMLAAQNDLNVAKEELKQTRADLESCERDLDIANNEYKTAKLQKDTAKLQLDGAKASGDSNRKNQAERDVHVAEMGVKAADAKVDWLEKKKKWLKRTRDAAEYHASSAAARYELEKAKLVTAKGMKPSAEFNVLTYETQDLESSKKYSEARLDADKTKADVLDLERKYQERNQQYTEAKATAAH